MKKFIEWALDLYQRFKPKFYNNITSAIVIAGIAMLSPSLLTVTLNNVLSEEFDFQLLGEYDPVVGLGLILLALIYNYFSHRVDRNNSGNENQTIKEIESSNNVHLTKDQPKLKKLSIRLLNAFTPPNLLQYFPEAPESIDNALKSFENDQNN